MRRFVALLTVVALSTLSLMAVAESAPAAERGDVIAVRVFGRLQNTSTDPTHIFVSNADLLSPTGEVVGTRHQDVTCSTAAPPPCVVLHIVTTFRFPEGDIVNEVDASLVPDPQYPGFFLVSMVPPGESIVSGTGAFAGRTGRVRGLGRHDAREFPDSVVFDDFWLIELDGR
jgi:hypothetical protein